MMENKLVLAREIAACLNGIEVQLISVADGILLRFNQESVYETFPPIVSDNAVLSLLMDMKPNCLYILSGVLDLCYVMIRINDSRRYLCAGPCLLNEFSESKTRSQLRQLRLSGSIVERITSYCRRQPMMTPDALHRFGVLLCRQILGLSDPIQHQHITYHWNRSDYPILSPKESDEESPNIRMIEMRYEASTALTEAVKQGNLSLAYGFIQGFQPGMNELVRSPNPLRNAQNLCIILNTQLRHAMEDLQIHPYQLDKVSGEIATHIETLKTQEAAWKYCAEIIRRYCVLSQEESYPHLNRLTKQAVIYIKNHLSDNITVKDTAKVLLVNANYLSSVFRQEAGMTFIDFLNQERIKQAAALLCRTNMQIQQIASAVGYNNTSYFNRQFVKFYGTSPREYRTNRLL